MNVKLQIILKEKWLIDHDMIKLFVNRGFSEPMCMTSLMCLVEGRGSDVVDYENNFRTRSSADFWPIDFSKMPVCLADIRDNLRNKICKLHQIAMF